MSVPPVNQYIPPTTTENNVYNPSSEVPSAVPNSVPELATQYPSEQELKERGQSIPKTTVPFESAPLQYQPNIPSVAPISSASVSYASSVSQATPDGAAFPTIPQPVLIEPPLTGRSVESTSTPNPYSSSVSSQPLNVSYASNPSSYDPNYSAGYSPNYAPPPSAYNAPGYTAPPPPPSSSPYQVYQNPPPPPSGPVSQVQCPSCKTILAVPPGSELFRCPCGQVLRNPYYIPSQGDPRYVPFEDEDDEVARCLMARRFYNRGMRSYGSSRSRTNVVTAGLTIG